MNADLPSTIFVYGSFSNPFIQKYVQNDNLNLLERHQPDLSDSELFLPFVFDFSKEKTA